MHRHTTIRPFFAFGRNVLIWVVATLIGSLVVSSCLERQDGDGERTIAKIAILQAEPQEWADALKLGFVSGLEAEGIDQARDVIIVLRSATGSGTQLDTLARLLAEDRDWTAVYTLGTQASQAYFGAMREYSAPMIFGAVTDPVSAGFYDGALSKPKKNLTGSQDIWPYDRQFELIRSLLPDAKAVGMVYNLAEANTVAALGFIREAAKEVDLGLVERNVETAQQIESAIAAVMSEGVDALYIGPDNLTQANDDAILEMGRKSKLPVFTGISGIVEKGAAGTVGTNYFEVGDVNGRQAAQIFKGTEARTIAPAVARKGDLYLNEKALTEVGLTVPVELRAEALKIY